MQLTDRAAERLKKLFPEGNPVPESTDPELAEIFANFAFDEVPAEDILGEETRNLAVLAALLGCGGAELFGKMLSAALKAGDVVEIAPEVKHWHGAAKDSWFSHLAVEVPAEGASNEWLEAVSDEDYANLK